MSGSARFLALALVLIAAILFVVSEDSASQSSSDSAGADSCRKLDAALRWYGTLYLFSGDEYMGLDDTGNETHVGPIHDWDGLPSNIDAAFQWSGNNAYYFMRGEFYFRYDHGFLSIPWSAPFDWNAYFLGGIDAAGNRNWQTYFFKGCTYTVWYSNFFGMSEVREIPLVLPCDLDAAFEKNDGLGTMVVIKGDEMWEWGPRTGEISQPCPVSDVYTIRSWTLCPRS